MLRSRFVLCTLLFLLIGSVTVCRAQDRITVKGTIVYVPSRDPIVSARIYAYNTVDEAREAMERMQKQIDEHKELEPGFCIPGYIDENGEFEFGIGIDRNGAILCMVGDAEFPFQIHPVRGHTKIDVEYQLTMLNDAIVSITTTKPKFKKPTVVGNTLKCGLESYPFPKPRLGRSNARFAVQTYVIDLNKDPGKDTVEYHYPIIMDGEEYYNTQIRRKGFNKQRDPLLDISDSSRLQYGWLTDTTTHIGWDDAYYLDNPDEQVKIISRMWWEDYNMVYCRDTMQLADSRRVSRPMRFLDYDVQSFSLNMNDPQYLRTAHPVRRDDARDLALQFEVGSARIDEKDSTSMAEMEKLLASIQAIVDDAENGSRMNEYTVYGTASPEGNYARNLQLAHQRMEYIRDRIQNVVRKRIGAYTNANVATWEQLADTLEAYNLFTEAEGVRAAVQKYPGNLDSQGARIRALPYYKSTIVPFLSKLRSVKVVYKYELFRNLTDSEILNKYRTDKAYRSGASELLSNEYWALYKMIKDSVITDLEEQEDILRRGVKNARLREKNWQLPENMLAEFIIKHGGKADTTLLARHIDIDFFTVKSDGTLLWADRPYTSLSGERYIKNPSPVVANQVVMMMKAGQFERAADLAQILKTSQDKSYMRLYYIARCLGGYFNDDSAEEADELYKAIEGTSPRNSFVINLAMEKFPQASLALDEMDPEDPVTHYLHAQYICQKNYASGTSLWRGFASERDRKVALKELAKCFRMDQKYINISQGDADICEDLIEPAIEESKKEEVLELEEELLIPDGLTADSINIGWYYDKKGEFYEVVNGKFLHTETKEEYKPE